MIRIELSLFLLVALLASALTLSHAQTVLSAATVNYAYTATNWAVSHYTCTTDPLSGYQYPPNDYINLANPSAATISTGDSVSVRFDFNPALHIRSSAVTNLIIEIRLTDPSYDSYGGYPTATPTISFTGTNVHSSTATSSGTGNYLSNPLRQALVG